MPAPCDVKSLALRARDGVLPVLRAYGLLTFSASARAGLVLLVATFARPESALLGLLAVVVAHGLAVRAGYARETLASGYYGYNSLLVGLSLAQVGPLDSRLVLLVVGGAALAFLLTAVLGDWLRSLGLPVLAVPFVVVTSLVWHTTLPTGAVPFWLAPNPPTAWHEPLGETVLRGLGAIIFQPTLLGGALVLVAVVLHSRITALALLAGAIGAAGVARGFGNGDAALVLPAAYNGALTFAAFSAAFYVTGPGALWVALGSSLLSGWLAASLLLPFAPLSVPVLAWPFVLVTLPVMRALALCAPGRAPTPVHLPGATAELNLAYARTLEKRLGLPGPPRFVLPVRGVWQVSQGVGGALTHRGPWHHALDFEVNDRDGFPFCGVGTRLDDYYCFGQPVLAAGAGVVFAVYEGAVDNPPGHQDLGRPWGNAVVLQHAPGLFSVVAHLQRGSISVVVGQRVVVGDLLARCGSSGRSPRPHLHFQAQASPELGAATLDFRLVNYVVHGASPRFERLGVPAEHARVESPELAPLAFPVFDAEVLVDGHRRIKLHRELTPLGEHRAVDDRGGDRLYFVPHEAGVVLTALQGPADGLCGALLQIAPHLPFAALPRLDFEEELAPEMLLPAPLRFAYRLLGIFGEPGRARVRGHVLRSQGTVVVESECDVWFLGRVVRQRRGRLELDRHGLSSLELRKAARDAPPLLRASRPHVENVVREVLLSA